MVSLCDLVNAQGQFFHICDYLKQQGIQDKVWVQLIAKEADWIVITADGGRQSRKGDKLPELCAESGIRHLVLSPKLSEKKSFEKVGALCDVWSEIALLRKEPPGTRWVLKIQSSSKVTGLKVWIDKLQQKKS